jgi:hypothetical protein
VNLNSNVAGEPSRRIVEIASDWLPMKVGS